MFYPWSPLAVNANQCQVLLTDDWFSLNQWQSYKTVTHTHWCNLPGFVTPGIEDLSVRRVRWEKWPVSRNQWTSAHCVMPNRLWLLILAHLTCVIVKFVKVIAIDYGIYICDKALMWVSCVSADTLVWPFQIISYLCLSEAAQPQSTCQVVKCYFAATLIILLHWEQTWQQTSSKMPATVQIRHIFQGV